MDRVWQPPIELVCRALPIAIVIAIAGLAYWWSSAPSTAPSAVTPMARTTTGGAVGVVVDVEGAVRHPGVLRLRLGARVIDAVDAAGGLLPGAPAGVNLARPLVDGELIVLGAQDAGAGASTGGRLDLNRATAAELDGLPGIGPVLAQRIVDYRTAHGPFRRTRDLTAVPGIGDAKLGDLGDAVTVG